MKTAYGIFASIIVIFSSGCSSSGNTGQKEAHEAEHAHTEEIELSEKQMQTVGITLGSFSSMNLGEGVKANGELMVRPQDMADVTPLLIGTIKNIYVSEGNYVKAGEVVARIENLEFSSLLSDYNDAKSRLQLAAGELERQQKLADHGAGIAKNLEKAKIEYELAQNTLKTYAIKIKTAGMDPDKIAEGNNTAAVKAPVSGVVTAIYGRIGGAADMSSPIMTIVDNSGIYAQLKIFEKDLGRIKKGDVADITLINGERTLQGTVQDIIPSIDPVSKTIDVRVSLTSGGETTMIPGMAVSAFVRTGFEETPVLPEEAVVTIEGRDYIYVLDNMEEHDGEPIYIFDAVEVVSGSRLNGYVEVHPIKNLPSDARVVVSKAFYIASMTSDHGEHDH